MIILTITAPMSIDLRRRIVCRLVIALVLILLVMLQVVLWTRLPPPNPNNDMLEPRNILSRVSNPQIQPINKENVQSSVEVQVVVAPQPVSSTSFDRGEELPTTNQPPREVVFSHGIILRPFQSWPVGKPLPCYAASTGGRDRRRARESTDRSSTRGFFFMKLMKTGGSTAAGIHVRMMNHIAQQQQGRQVPIKDYDGGRNNTVSKQTIRAFSGKLSCQGKWDHDWAYRMFRNRNRDESFTWTVLREPTTRVISQFFHFEVTRLGTSTNDGSFQHYLWNEYQSRDALYQYYLHVLSTREYKYHVNVRDVPSAIQEILSEYDFIGISERMDETAVVLAMLLGLRLADVLYLNAKESGGYDDAQGGGKCQLIQRSFVSEGMRTYFAQPAWKRIIFADQLFYEAVNASFDLTIEYLGRERFEGQLARFRNALTVARETCLRHEWFPCTSHGERNRNKSCLWKDSGCGYECLDRIATRLDLW